VLRIGTDVQGNVTVVTVRGEFDRCAMDALPGIFERAMADAGPRVVVDLSHASFVDSGAIALLLQARKKAHSAGGDLVLSGCPALVQRCLDTLGLQTVLARHADVSTALASFA